METENQYHDVDHKAIIVSQIMLIVLSCVAFIINSAWFAAVITLLMLLGVLTKKPTFGFIYRFGLKPLNVVKPLILKDNPEPHHFAQLLGTIFLAAGTLLLFVGVSTAGWLLIWIVIALAALNAFGGFCVGCALYYWFGRMHLLGFTKEPPRGGIPGKRPYG